MLVRTTYGCVWTEIVAAKVLYSPSMTTYEFERVVKVWIDASLSLRLILNLYRQFMPLLAPIRS